MPLCITRGVFQLNETMFWYDDCVLKGFYPHPQPSTCGTLHVSHKSEFNVVTMSRFKGMLANLFTSGKTASGKTASGGGGECTLLLFLPVSIKLDLKLLYLVYGSVKITAAGLSLFKNTNTKMLIKTSNMLL